MRVSISVPGFFNLSEDKHVRGLSAYTHTNVSLCVHVHMCVRHSGVHWVQGENFLSVHETYGHWPSRGTLLRLLSLHVHVFLSLPAFLCANS